MITILPKIFGLISTETTSKPVPEPASSTKIHKALVGDIGGTNIRLRLIQFQKDSKTPTIIKQSENMRSFGFNSMEDAIRAFLSDVSEENWPQIAGIGLAGAVLNNQNIVTNAPHWPKVDGDKLRDIFKMQQFKLFNDFEVASYACLNLSSDEVVKINDAEEIPNKIKTVCGAGTGLGVANIVPYPKNDNSGEHIYQVWPGEGGHSAFAPVNELQSTFLLYLLKYFPERTQIALEYAFVGPAIPYMYGFLKSRHLEQENVIEKEESTLSFDVDDYHRRKHSSDEKERESAKFPSQQIFEYGVSNRDVVCAEVVKLFVSIYETSIGDMMVRSLPYSGIYLVGSMSIAVLPYIQAHKDTFMKEYKENRPYLAHVFEKIPLYVVKNTDIGLDGAFVVTRQMVN